MEDELSRALAGLAGAPEDPGAQRAVYAALLTADVHVPRDAGGQVLIDRGSPGRGPALVLFSTAETAAAWGAAADTVTVGARELCEWAAAQGVERVVLDTAGPVAVTLGSWEVRRLATGAIPTPGSDERLAVALPRPPLPDAFTQALRAAAEPLAGLAAVSVYEADPVRGRRHLVLGLHADGPLDAFVDPLHAALEPVAPDGALLNFAPPFGDLEPAAQAWSRS